MIIAIPFPVTAQRTGSISGVVRSNHQPLVAATIILKGRVVQHTTITDTAGHFSLQGLPAGDYTLEVSTVGFETITRLVSLLEGESIRLHLQVKVSVHELEGVNVTGSRPERPPVDNVIGVNQIPMPVTVIDRKTIEKMGSRRLDEVLREQTGLAVVSDLGAGNRAVGLQMQGFSSEYITILIDGQPMVGRVDGNFDLSRISVAGIERIEIIKGASSSLYGSQALGGVINIITRQHSDAPEALIRLREGTYRTTDVMAEGETPFAGKKGSAFLSGDSYRTGGFNVNPYLLAGSETAPPYNSVSLQGRARYQLTDASTLLFSGLYSGRHSVMDQDFGAQPIRDVLDENNVNGMIALDTRLKGGSRLVSRYYLTRYSSLQNVSQQEGGAVLESDNFTEYLHRVEEQVSRDIWGQRLSLIGGAGGEYQKTDAQTQGAGGHLFDYFAYTQATWHPVRCITLIAGLRYDGNTLYGGKINPSAALRYSPVSWLTLKASMGQGFKTPTYVQMYQVFTNLAQGYTVVGANAFQAGIQTLKAAGQIGQVWDIASQVTNLKAETSTSFDAGFSLTPVKTLEITANGFYNSIDNLINPEQVGIKSNGAQLFSYINIARAFTTGAEAGIHWEPLAGLTVSAGYQLLYARDRTVIDSIRVHSPGYATVRTPSGIRASAVKDYFGLPGRSRHMANLQAFYTFKPWGLSLSIRASYRSRYGFLDTDNNGFIDPYDVFVKGYCLVNAAIQKKLLNGRLMLELTVDNLANYTDYLMPAQPGRMILGGVAWRFFKRENKQREHL